MNTAGRKRSADPVVPGDGASHVSITLRNDSGSGETESQEVSSGDSGPGLAAGEAETRMSL